MNEYDELQKKLDAAHRRLDEIGSKVVRLEVQHETLATSFSRFSTLPEKLSTIEATLQAIEKRLPQQAAPISPWLVLMTVLGWGVTIVLAVLR